MPLDVYVPPRAAAAFSSFTSGAAGQLPFGDGAGGLTDSASLAWNNTLKTLSVLGTVSKVSAAGSTWDTLSVPASTLTLTGGVGPVTALSLATLAQPTITSSSATTVTDSATLTIANAPAAGGSVTLTRAHALWVKAGNARLDGRLAVGGVTAPSMDVAVGTDVGASNLNTGLTIGNGTSGMRVGLYFAQAAGTGIRLYYTTNSSAGSRRFDMDSDGYGISAFLDFSRISLQTQSAAPINIGAAASQLGFFGVSDVARQTRGATLTNSVTVGGSNDVIADFADLTTYSNSAAAIRNNIYQLARAVRMHDVALRAYGLET